MRQCVRREERKERSATAVLQELNRPQTNTSILTTLSILWERWNQSREEEVAGREGKKEEGRRRMDVERKGGVGLCRAGGQRVWPC